MFYYTSFLNELRRGTETILHNTIGFKYLYSPHTNERTPFRNLMGLSN